MKFQGHVGITRTVRIKDPTFATNGTKYDEEVLALVEVEIDQRAIIDYLGVVAVNNKSRQSRAMMGAVKARVVEEKILSTMVPRPR